MKYLILLVVALSMSAIADDQAYVPITGKFSVDGKGASNYTIKIDTVPAKHQPRVALSYSSQGGGGFVAHGWSLHASPLIRICSLNKRQDNKWANISLNMGADDYKVNRFCMNGKRLSAINGNYGADKTTYQTELFSRKVITSNGKCGDGPCSFTVQSSDGSVQVYGGDANSTVQMEDKDILVWGAKSDTDKYGNTIQFSYLPSDQTNVLYPSEINYFISKDGKDSRKVTFTYDPIAPTNRIAKRVGLGGYSFKPDKILTQVNTYDIGNRAVFQYTLTNDFDKFSNSYKLLSLDKKSADETQNYYTHTFGYKDYQPDTPSFNKVNTVTIPATVTDWDSIKLVIMDKYGDGYKGVGVISNENNRAIFKFARGDKDGKLTLAEDEADLGEFTPTDKNSDSYTFLAVDKNGDGLNDLVKIFKGTDGDAYVETYLSISGKPDFEKDPVVQPFNSPYVTGGKNATHYVGRDINGDGLTDIIEMKPTSDEQVSTYQITVYYADVKGGFPTKKLINSEIENDVIPKVNQSISFSDSDKDTLSDLFLLSSQSGDVFATPLYNRQGKFLAPDGDSTKNIKLGKSGDWKGLPAYNFLDFNNDGLSDLVKFDYSDTMPVTGNIYINTGNLFGDMLAGSGVGDNTTDVFSLTSAGEDQNNAHNITFVDINGDGQPDALKYMGGTGDPKDQDNTYFETFLHTGNTFVKSQDTPLFGAHTRNVVSSMGDNPIASIISVMQSNGSVNISVYENSIKPPDLEMISIDNGIGLTYNIDYQKVSPFIDYAKIEQPGYPNILLSKVRMVVNSYTTHQDDGTEHGFKRQHDYTYKFPIYNRHDWMFSGYRNVTESIASLDKLKSMEYYVTYPIRGKIKSTTVSQLSTGIPFNKDETTWGFDIKYPNVDPKVIMVYKTGAKSTVYQDSQQVNAPIAWVKNKTFTYENEWGMDVSSTEGYDGGDVLYKCKRYTNNVSGKGAFIIGMETGQLSTKSDKQCTQFKGNHLYDVPYVPTTDDLMLSYTKLSTDGLMSSAANLRYSDSNKTYHTKQFTYDAQGNVITSSTSADYTDITGEFKDPKKTLVMTNLYDDTGYVVKRTKGEFSESFKTDSRFGATTYYKDASGKETDKTINSIGAVVKTTINGKVSDSYGYAVDNEGRFKYGVAMVAGNPVETKSYLNAAGKPWKHTKLTNENKLLTLGEVKLNPNTGQIIAKLSGYFNEKDAEQKLISYDKRWVKNKEVKGVQVDLFQHVYSEGELSITHSGNDPTHASKGTVILSKSIHNPANRTTTKVEADKTQSTVYKNLLGNIIKEVDNRGFTSTRTFDFDGKMIGSYTPDSGNEVFAWDGSGKVIAHNKGIEHNTYAYDIHERALTATRTEGDMARTVHYTWDDQVKGFFNLGRLTGIQDKGNHINVNYDNDGNITQKIWNVAGKQYDYEFLYYPNAIPLSVTYPDKSSVTYSYNKTGELATVSYAGETKAVNPDAAIGFSDYGITLKPQQINYGKSVSLKRAIDGWGRSIEDTFSQGDKVISSLKYGWDNTGNITSQTRDGKVTQYTFDMRKRLVNAKSPTLDLSYQYDANNNLLQNGANKFTVESKTNRLATGTIAGKPVTFKHDALGRLLGDGEESYVYGDSGRLESIKNGGNTVSISYFNRKKLQDNVAIYLDGGLEIVKAGHKKRIQSFSQTWEVIHPDGKIDYIFPDRLRSNLMSVDSKTLTPTSSFEYEPYGKAHATK
ncbi:conserved hypothetical protein [Bathymodiolus platifrons methanotrophic gill symbiont]|uniref:SpvB/TcaC N-terminal domain-containing protein n=1 Tax=Bathymodiolus platifrons methanotrophic gill symbiont TaxID=113268 RepID=UPI000B411A4F|nr:SpvB/TcaC N-terminal domain-containing protein [Bathymodiolus platifrons methanotrophic gill symbiont]GAW87659.1 conserved hypothetical protein [Bathymodiolus platifrons methanotrophic gill symbiont]